MKDRLVLFEVPQDEMFLDLLQVLVGNRSEELDILENAVPSVFGMAVAFRDRSCI